LSFKCDQNTQVNTAGLENDFRKNEESPFHQYFIFFDGDYGDHHHITCTLPLLNREN